MQTVKSKLAIFVKDQPLFNDLSQYEPLFLKKADISTNKYEITILICDEDIVSTDFSKNLSYKKLFFLANKEKINLVSLQKLQPDKIIDCASLKVDFLNDEFELISQKEQDETYLHLSTELNQQYEILKTELEQKLSEKSKNLVESRKQIFEINNRVELLRKSLYTTVEIKNLTEAEEILNDLLVKHHLVTWLKIIKKAELDSFIKDLSTLSESTCHTKGVVINDTEYVVCFFKGDKKPFKKQDSNYFDKLVEALQINLNRYNNLLALQQNERLFDLAFHSSPHPIIIINNQYEVLQANLAAEKHADETKENQKCFELLFGRNRPCAGCKLGSKFEIQHEIKYYAVQSSSFKNSIENENQYWVHFYEDISEQKALESKFQQTARLSELGLISSSIAHELNNPLGGILSYLQIMKMELPAQHSFHSDLDFLTDAANRMKKHIEDLLFFSRKEDLIKLEEIELNEVMQKNLDLLQMQLKKEHLIVSFVAGKQALKQKVSILHFRNIIHLAFQFFLHKLKIKKQTKANFNGLVEVKIFQDQMNSYLSFQSNLGPHDLKLNSNDLSLITLEKSILDQGFQLVISEPQPMWMQVLIKMPL